MDTKLQSLKSKLTFKNATILLCFFNLVTAFFLLQGFLSTYSPKYPSNTLHSDQLRRIKESEEIRRAMQPLELIRRVREIEQEISGESETDQNKKTKQTAALDLSKRLTDARTNSDGTSIKALEEWRKRKMERARQRELGKNSTSSS